MIEAILTIFLSMLELGAALYYAEYVWRKGSDMRERKREGKRKVKEYLRAVEEGREEEYLLAVKEGREKEYLRSLQKKEEMT